MSPGRTVGQVSLDQPRVRARSRTRRQPGPGAGTWSAHRWLHGGRPVSDTAIVAAAAAGVPPRELFELVERGDEGRVWGTAVQRTDVDLSELPSMPANGFVVTLADPGYPAALRSTSAPPRILYGIGEPSVLARAGIAVIGTRYPSVLGERVAEAAAAAVAGARAPLITGGARGCDEIAATAAVQLGVPVVLVLGTGPDQVADSQTAERVADVLASGGVVVSEHPFGTGTDAAAGYQPAAYTSRLMARNRIVVGLAGLTVPASGTFGSGTGAAVWSAFATGRPVVVASPRPGARSLPDAALAAALAHPSVPGVEQLRAAGCPARLAIEIAQRLAGQGPLAHAVAHDSDELEELVTALWWLSPWRASAHDGNVGSPAD